jgi:hypothetical protein
MVKSRWRDSTMVKTQCYIAFSPSYHRDFTIVPLRFHHRTIAPSRHRVFTIVPSRFHHRTIALSPSYHRVFTIVPSRFHHRAIVFSPSYHCVFTIVPSRFHHRTIAFRFLWWLISNAFVRRVGAGDNRTNRLTARCRSFVLSSCR